MNIEKNEEKGLTTEEAFEKLSSYLKSLIFKSKIRRTKKHALGCFLSWISWNDIYPLNIFCFLMIFIMNILLIFVAYYSSEVIYSIFVVLFSELLMLSFYFAYFIISQDEYIYKLKDCLSGIENCKKEIKYPCLFCEPSDAITLVFAIRDCKLIKIPPHLLMPGDIFVLNDYNLENILFENTEVELIKKYCSKNLEENSRNLLDFILANGTEWKIYRVRKPLIKHYIKKIMNKSSHFNFISDPSIIYLLKFFKNVFLFLAIIQIILIHIKFIIYDHILEDSLIKFAQLTITVLLPSIPISTQIFVMIFVIFGCLEIRRIFISIEENSNNNYMHFFVLLKILWHDFYHIICRNNLLDQLQKITVMCSCEKQGVLCFSNKNLIEICFMKNKNEENFEKNRNKDFIFMNYSQFKLEKLKFDMEKVIGENINGEAEISLVVQDNYKNNFSCMKPLLMAEKCSNICKDPLLQCILSSFVQECNFNERCYDCLCVVHDQFSHDLSTKLLRKIINIYYSNEIETNFSSTSFVIQYIVKIKDDIILFSRGSLNTILSNCKYIWNGQDLIPLNKNEKSLLMEEISAISHEKTCLSFSMQLLSNHTKTYHDSEIIVNKYFIMKNEIGIRSYTLNLKEDNTFQLKNIYKSVFNEKCHVFSRDQTFVGCFVFSEAIINNLIEFIHFLDIYGIKFTYFSKEMNIKSHDLLKKLGMDCSWNTYISLKPNVNTYPLVNQNNINPSNVGRSKRKLPSGIPEIKDHIKNTDDVPLHVPLYTNSSYTTIKHMIEILQENNEIICMIHSCHNFFLIAQNINPDVQIQIVPVIHDKCIFGNKHSSTFVFPHGSVEDNNLLRCPTFNSKILQLCALINTIDSIYVFMPGSWIRIKRALKFSREMINKIQKGLLHKFICLTILQLTSFLILSSNNPCQINLKFLTSCIFLKIPLTACNQIFSSSDNLSYQYVAKKKNYKDSPLKERIFFFILFIVVPTSLVLSSLIHINYYIFYKNLNASFQYFYFFNNNYEILRRYPDHYFFINTLTNSFINIGNTTFFYTISMCMTSLSQFLSWRNSTNINITIFVLISMTAGIETFSALNNNLMKKKDFQSNSILIFNTIIIILWNFCIFLIFELIKKGLKKKIKRVYLLERMKFETKLGMHSPI